MERQFVPTRTHRRSVSFLPESDREPCCVGCLLPQETVASTLVICRSLWHRLAHRIEPAPPRCSAECSTPPEDALRGCVASLYSAHRLCQEARPPRLVAISVGVPRGYFISHCLVAGTDRRLTRRRLAGARFSASRARVYRTPRRPGSRGSSAPVWSGSQPDPPCRCAPARPGVARARGDCSCQP